MTATERAPDFPPDRERLDAVCWDQLDPATGMTTRYCVPDPTRYKRIVREAQSGWQDRLDGTILMDDLVARMFSTPNVPSYIERPEIRDALAYVEGRRAAVRERLTTTVAERQVGQAARNVLARLQGQAMGFVILAFDIVGSTQLALRLPVRDLARLTSVVLYEAGETVIQFHGHVLKNGGDGIIAYFAEPSFNRKNDLALDCALTLHHLVYGLLNGELVAASLPKVEVRIGLESGEALVENQGSPSTNAGADLVGAVINMAVKIQGLAQPGEILVGRAADLLLHVDWRDQLEAVQLPPTWTYLNRRGRPYEVYRYTGRHERLKKSPFA